MTRIHARSSILFAAAALLLASLASLASFASGQQSLRGRRFTDTDNAYRIDIPKGWVRMPTNVEEKWVMAHFTSKREYVGSARAGLPVRLKGRRAWRGKAASIASASSMARGLLDSVASC